MPDLDRMVAGLRCREVLADLSDFLDGLLSETRVAAIRAHLAECTSCARFGTEVAQVLAALREGHAEVTPALPDGAITALRRRVLGAIREDADTG